MTDRERERVSAPQSELLPCPFCGDSALLQGLGAHNVICTNCNVLTPDFDTAAEAIAAWNRRSPASPEVTEEGLVKAILWAVHDVPLPADEPNRNYERRLILRDAINAAIEAYQKATGGSPSSERSMPSEEELADLRSARIALPMEQRKHAKARRRVHKLERALKRLASSEAFCIARALDAGRDAELIARLRYAEEALAEDVRALNERGKATASPSPPSEGDCPLTPHQTDNRD